MPKQARPFNTEIDFLPFTGILDSSAAKPAARQAAVGQNVPVPKRARPADIEGPPQRTKKAKVCLLVDVLVKRWVKDWSKD